MAKIFLDASYAIALASRTDQHHARAVELASWLATAQVPLVTTRPVILEIGNALARQRYRRAAVTLLESTTSGRQDFKHCFFPLDRWPSSSYVVCMASVQKMSFKVE